jgi:hypothetical protein
MPRSIRLRNFIREYKESPRFEKLSFIPPFIILVVEGILLVHAITINVPDMMVIELTIILLAISVIEMFFVIGEIHEHYMINNFNEMLTIRLDDFITEKNLKNVKIIVKDFIENYPHYAKHRNEVYHITCHILETHQERILEEDLRERLNKYIEKNKKMNVDEIVRNFIKQHPKYKRYAEKIYKLSISIKLKN